MTRLATGSPPQARGLLDRLRGPLLLGAGVAAATLFVRQVDPNEPGHYLGCPFLNLTGQFCPGCGGLRTVHHLAHGELELAWGMNPLVVVMIPVAVALWGFWLVRAWHHRPAWSPPLRAVYAFGAVVFGFWVVRNLPFAEPYLSHLT